MAADRSPGITRPVRYGPHCFVSGHGRPFRVAYAARFHLGWDPESAMGHYFSVTRHNPVMNQEVSPRPVSADADTPASSPSHQARTASGPLQGLRPMQAQHAPAVAPNQASSADAGPAIEAPDLLPALRTEAAPPSIPAQHPRSGRRSGVKCRGRAGDRGVVSSAGDVDRDRPPISRCAPAAACCQQDDEGSGRSRYPAIDHHDAGGPCRGQAPRQLSEPERADPRRRFLER